MAKRKVTKHKVARKPAKRRTAKRTVVRKPAKCRIIGKHAKGKRPRKSVVGPSVKCGLRRKIARRNPIAAVGWAKTRKLTRKAKGGYKRRMGLKNPGASFHKGVAGEYFKTARKLTGKSKWSRKTRAHFRTLAQAHKASIRPSLAMGLKNPCGSHKRKLPAFKKNPLLSIINPPVQGIPMAKFRSPEFVANYNKACKLYKAQHGCWPTKARRVVLPLGSKRITDSTVVAYVGHAPTETYVSRVNSRKGKGQPYVHKYDKMPVKVTDGSGKMYLTLPGTHRMKKGWITG